MTPAGLMWSPARSQQGGRVPEIARRSSRASPAHPAGERERHLMQRQQWPNMDRFVVRDTIPENIEVLHRVVDVTAHAVPLYAGKRPTQAWHPKGTVIPSGQQAPPESEWKFRDDLTCSLGPSVQSRVVSRRGDVVCGLGIEDPARIQVPSWLSVGLGRLSSQSLMHSVPHENLDIAQHGPERCR